MRFENPYEKLLEVGDDKQLIEDLVEIFQDAMPACLKANISFSKIN